MKYPTCLLLALVLTLTTTFAQTVITADETYRSNGSIGSLGNFDSTGSSYLGGGNVSPTSFGIGSSTGTNQFRGMVAFDLTPVLSDIGSATSISFETGGFSFDNGGFSRNAIVEVASPQGAPNGSLADPNVTMFSVYGNQTEGSVGTFDPDVLTFNQQLVFDVTTVVQAAGFDISNPWLWIRIRHEENGWIGGANNVFGFNELESGWSLTIVPEPSSYALFAGMLAIGLIVLRRR